MPELKKWSWPSHRTSVLSDGTEVGYLKPPVYLSCVVVGVVQLHFLHRGYGELSPCYQERLDRLLFSLKQKKDREKVKAAIRKFKSYMATKQKKKRKG